MNPGTRVLVTGASGFIGTHLTRRLVEEGLEVVALDVGAPSANLATTAAEYHRGDVRDGELLRRLLDGVDTVFHLASVHLDVHASEDDFFEVNVDAVSKLVGACAHAGVRRLIHTSSVGIFGHVMHPPAGEDAPKNPLTAYEKTKLAGEQRALGAAPGHGLDVIVLRPAWVYGPGCPRTTKLLEAIRHRRFFYVGDGSNLRHPVFIDDMVRAYLLAADAPASASQGTYIIAGPRYLTLREMVDATASVLHVAPPRIRIPRWAFWPAAVVAEVVFRLARKQPPLSRRSLSFFQNDNAFSNAAAQDRLGYRPAIDFAEGLRQTLADVEAPNLRPSDALH